ncbi:MAG: LysR family transcriptional regulator [Pseudomonadota bacterium]
MDTIDTMRAFVTVAGEGSFTRAGELLGRSTRMVSKQVADLETRLGVLLFNRTTRSVALTEVGRAYLDRCRPLLTDLDDLETEVREQQTELTGTIRVTAPTAFGNLRLLPVLAPFLEQHPRIELDLRLSDVPVSLVDEGLDLALRIGVPADSSLMARRLVTMPTILCAAPDYLARMGIPDSPHALKDHDCLIDSNQRDPGRWRFGAGSAVITVPVTGRFVVNSPSATATMAVQGLGIARCPLYQVEAALAAGTLRRLLPELEDPAPGVYALYPYNRFLTARVRSLIDHLADQFAS